MKHYSLNKFFLLSIKMSLKIDEIKIDKNKFYKSKQPIDLNLVGINKTALSDKFELTGDGFKYFIGYKEDNIIRPLCIISSQMSGYIKFFKKGGKNMPYIIKDGSILVQYNEI